MIEQNQEKYLQKLKEAVAIPSVSGDASYRSQVFQMGEWLEGQMKTLGISVQRHFPGKQMLEGKELDLPPILYGTYGSDTRKKNVLVYGNFQG